MIVLRGLYREGDIPDACSELITVLKGEGRYLQCRIKVRSMIDMNIIDYLTRDIKEKIYWDDAGNMMYLDKRDGDHTWRPVSISEFMNDGGEFYFLPKEEYDRYGECDISIAKDLTAADMKPDGRYHYHMRGKPISEAQAFDIIRRTDVFFYNIRAIETHPDYLGSGNFDNRIIGRDYAWGECGWIHTDGTVGVNLATAKFQQPENLLFEWYQILMAFPYLDLIIALRPCYIWREIGDEEFLEEVKWGIYVHDHKVEVLNRTDAVAKYQEYNALYGKPEEKFKAEYYGENQICQVELPYLKRCIEAYGLDADEELSRVPKYLRDWRHAK